MNTKENSFICLQSKDSHRLDAFYCPDDNSSVGLIVIHEIFGLTSFIQNVCNYWADKGYQTIAPALYDRYEKNVAISYDDEGYKKAIDYKQRVLNWDNQLLDIDAAKNYLLQHGVRKIGIIGFSWGGTLSWLAACRLDDIACISSYYGTHIFQFRDETPRCPALLQFAERDELISKEHIEKIQELHSGLTIFTHPAGHGFRCEEWREYDYNVSKVADDISDNFFQQNLIIENKTMFGKL